MRPAEFNTAMVHDYRAEIQRANVWRLRLDNTTNWAVVATGAAISFALSAPDHHHLVIILNLFLVTLFLWIEARRYRYYELWSRRARLMETDFFAAMLVPPFSPSPEWAASLADSLLRPSFPISLWEAFGRRFRRNYAWLYLILAGTWLFKVYLHPVPAASTGEMLARISLGPLPGWAILAAGLVLNGALFAIGLATIGLTEAPGEVLPKFAPQRLLPILDSVFRPQTGARPEAGSRTRPASPAQRGRGQQALALIVASCPEGIAGRVLRELRRGSTALHGRGMYAQQEREVLLVAVAAAEVKLLKAIVRAEDPNALVIVTPAHEILGRGFQPLER
jgi:uncharacterized membrane protein